MKKLLIAVAAVLLTVAAHAQTAQVTFGNLGGGVNAPVFLGSLTSNQGPGPNYTAELFLQGAGGAETSISKLSFRPPGTGSQAIADRYWIATVVDVAGKAVGDSATFIVRGYRTDLGSAAAARAAGLLGESNPVTVTLGGGTVTPPSLTGLQSFVIPIPEPSTIALGFLGAAALLLRRRK
jgi:hypothetical protein